jgi:Na+-transporting NADH:ubiquinone oxidoreductase subunit B
VKPIRRLVDKVKPQFEKGGKFEKFHPAFEALETFLFTPGITTTDGVHVRDSIDLKRTMITVVIALIPPLLFGIWNVGYQHYLAFGMEMTHVDYMVFGLQKVLPIVVVSYAVGLGVEFIFAIVKGHPISEGYLVTGMLIPLILPVTIPLWMVALAAIFCTLIGKEIFGGTGMNFMNPALLARVFLFFAFPVFMSG